MNNQQPGSSQQPNGAQSTSSFPPPPAYYRNYGSSVANPPPPPAIPRVFTAYGDQIDLEAPPIRSLAEQGIPQLYAEGGDWKVEMKKLQGSVMAAFTDLVKICIEAPDSEERQTKLEDIRIIYINMNHMLNLLRPIQGLDNIAGMLEEQIENLETSSRTLSANLERGRQVIARDIEKILKNNPLTPIPDIPDFSRRNRTGVQDTQPDRGFVTAHRVTDASRAFHAELTRDIMNRQQDTSESGLPIENVHSSSEMPSTSSKFVFTPSEIVFPVSEVVFTSSQIASTSSANVSQTRIEPREQKEILDSGDEAGSTISSKNYSPENIETSPPDGRSSTRRIGLDLDYLDLDPPPPTPEGNADENIAEPVDQEENAEGIAEPRGPEENPEE